MAVHGTTNHKGASGADASHRGLTQLTFIVDRSGSMAGLESDTIGGFNGMLAKQRAIPGDCSVTTVLFSNRTEMLHDHVDLRKVPDLTGRDYQAGGSTALLDAIGSTIDEMVARQRHAMPSGRADHVLFVIITDGYENASRRYSWAQVRRMLSYERERYGWEFVFLGANIDAARTAGDFGIKPECAADFHADGQGIRASFAAVACVATAVRAGADHDGEYMTAALRGVRDDYRSRSHSSR